MKYSDLLAEYRRKHKRLVEPNQGFESLSSKLWLAYSMGRKRGFTDLGTYANKSGDHGYYPAFAFDLGHKTRFFFKGWNYFKARRLASLYVKHADALNINYVILGRRIWSQKYPYWHKLMTGDTSHDFHIHVSAVH